ncbi:hypothetical protein [Paractinoplanes toevensis]|uniref:Uncharacterized protein n=1 Tax=Paractinoplanes toevensis TaxID=571911 RepID=A0A919T896_9ACTN|nr:hypothetical protein [Actinoplanes toevensis]GIM89695.1 hypothetical protein Ato02nite_014880 [Actinoplanes toevensis]
MNGAHDDQDALAEDWRRVLKDVAEALATGREPEDVQAERHAQEREAPNRATRRGNKMHPRSAKSRVDYQPGRPRPY